MKRILIATLFGVVAGLLCAAAGFFLVGIKLTPLSFLWIMLNRTVLGFVIGISALRLHWALHGMLLAVIVGSLFSLNALMTGSDPALAAGTLVGSMIFGLMIEFFTTVVFKQRQTRVTAQPQAAKAAATN